MESEIDFGFDDDEFDNRYWTHLFDAESDIKDTNAMEAYKDEIDDTTGDEDEDEFEFSDDDAEYLDNSYDQTQDSLQQLSLFNDDFFFNDG